LEERHADEKSKLTSLTREYESLLAENTRSREGADHAQKQVLSMEEKRAGTLQAVEDLKAHLCEVCQCPDRRLGCSVHNPDTVYTQQ